MKCGVIVYNGGRLCEAWIYEETLDFYCDMPKTSTQPNHFTFTSVFSTCANLVDLELGKGVHHDIISSEL